MNSSENNSNKFDTDRLRYWKVKRFWNRFRKIGLYSVLACLIGFLLIDYLVHVPHERHAKDAGYFQKLKLGASKFADATWLNITAEQEDPNTKLPIAEIYIKGYRQDRLNSNLPESGRNEQKAKFKYQNESYDVNVRYKGDSINHWAFPQKSWRVIMGKRKDHDGMTEINLNVPRVRSQFSNWLGYTMAQEFDQLIVPDVDIVHFRLNRQYDGIRLLLEQPNAEFVEKRNLPPGKIYVGDINSEQIYGDVPRKRLYLDSQAWNVTSNTPDVSQREMGDMLRTIGQVHNPYEFYYQISKHLEVDAVLQYIALLEIVGSVHVDATHNGKFYFNSYSGKFKPIVWDTVAYFWNNDMGFDLAPNELFRTLLYNPGLREKKDQYIWEVLNGRLSVEELIKTVEETRWLVSNDVKAFALKLHANDKGIEHISNAKWDASVTELKEVIVARHNSILNRLKLNDTSYRIVGTENPNQYLLAVSTQAASGAILEAIKIDSSKAYSIKRRGLDDLNKPVRSEVLNVQGELNDHLYSKRKHIKGEGFKVIPATYVYEISFASAPKNIPAIELSIKNPFTGESFQPNYDESIVVDAQHKKNSVWWDPEDFNAVQKIEFAGEKVLREDLVIDKWKELNVLPGTSIKLAKGVSIIADGGKLNFLGTESSPVKISKLNQNQEWGVLAGINGAELNFKNVVIDGGSSEIYSNVRFDSALSIHYAKAIIEKCIFNNNFITARYAEAELNNSSFNSIFEFPLSIENSIFSENENTYNKIKPVHSPTLVNNEGHGTAGRWEREYKYTFTNFNPSEHDPLEIAEGVRKALELKAADKNFWSVAKHTPNNFYTDEEAEDYLYSDIYFDTESRLNHKYGVSYRYRNRFKSEKDYFYHTKDYYRSKFWPYRLEFQAKTQREELGGGFSKTLESRFEFRKESEPFSERNFPPSAPWDRDIFIPYFQTGVFDGLTTGSAKSVMQFYQDKTGKQEQLFFEPVFVLITNRFRQHLNIKTPWGSGPNPEQAYIVTLDHSKAYDANTYLRFLETRRLGNKKYPEPLPESEIVELEVEFERNVSEVLDNEIQKSTGTKKGEELTEVRKAFLADQEKIMQVVSDYFAKSNLVVKPIGKSKYVQVMDALEGEIK